MTPNFDPHNYQDPNYQDPNSDPARCSDSSLDQHPDRLPITHSHSQKVKSSSEEALNSLKRDRFELLSAYLDGEVTPDERRQVEAWLKEDLAVQHLYARLLKLRHGVRHLPVPASEQPVEHTVQQVVSRLERRPKRALWGGMAIAAMFVSALVGGLPNAEYAPQVARSPQSAPEVVPQEGLMIALDKPIIEIPKAAKSTPRNIE